MGRDGKGKSMEMEELQRIGETLKRSVEAGRRGGPCTPSFTWKFGIPASGDDGEDEDGGCRKWESAAIGESRGYGAAATASARKLGANLWEVEPHLKMSCRGARRHHSKDQVSEAATSHLSDIPADQQEVPSPLRRQVKASHRQHDQSFIKNDHTLQPISTASRSSSMEVMLIGQSSYSVKTSTQLLKVLNRIWTLEEQHASDKSQAKALKLELNIAWARIKELLQERHTCRQEMNALARRLSGGKLAWRKQEQDQIKAAVQSVQEELDGEKNLRKRSESLHRQLAQELSGVKPSLSNALTELQQERRTRVLLEDLCDELAKGIRDYERKVRSLKLKPASSSSHESPDRLVLHVSEAWLDWRLQMKAAGSQNYETVDKLCFEIETFLRKKNAGLAGHSLGLFSSKEGVSVPVNAGDTDLEGPLKETEGLKGCFVEGDQIQNLVMNEASLHPRNDQLADPREQPCQNCSILAAESPGEWLRGLKKNTLKEKLLEARLEAQQMRLKASRGSSS